MSLIICPECSGKVSDKANMCPHCGYPINENLNVQKSNNILYNLRFIKAKSKVIAISKISKITKESVEDIKKIVDNCEIFLSNIDINKAYIVKQALQKDNIEVKIEDISGTEIFESSIQNTVIDDNIPKCPTCGSTNIRKILGTKKAASIIGFGILSNNISKTFECLNCKYKW